jgi:hypothetical protein
MAEKSSVEWHRSQLDPNDPRCLSSAAWHVTHRVEISMLPFTGMR